MAAGLLMVSAPMFAHHGSGISYDLTKPWTSRAVIVDFKNGWGKIRSEEALKPGTKVTLTVCTAKVGGQAGVVTKIANEQGEEIITRSGGQ